VTGDRDSQFIPAAGIGNSPDGPRQVNGMGDFSIGSCLSRGNLLESPPYLYLKNRAVDIPLRVDAARTNPMEQGSIPYTIKTPAPPFRYAPGVMDSHR